jgi:uncharacterized protein
LNSATQNYAIITGASSGIGAATAKKLSEKNIKTIAIARSIRDLKKVKSTISIENRSNFVPIVSDISSEKGIKLIMDALPKKGKCMILINNAGIGYNKPFIDHSNEDMYKIMQTNVLGHALLTREVLSKHEKGERLRVYFVTSLAGKIGFPLLSMYTASKFAIEGLVEVLRQEYRDSNVSFTVIRPGITDTNFFQKAGMDSFHKSMKGKKQFHSSESVADEFIKSIFLEKRHRSIITIGNDACFLKLLPFIPFNKRFKVLDFFNKL